MVPAWDFPGREAYGRSCLGAVLLPARVQGGGGRASDWGLGEWGVERVGGGQRFANEVTVGSGWDIGSWDPSVHWGLGDESGLGVQNNGGLSWKGFGGRGAPHGGGVRTAAK